MPYSHLTYIIEGCKIVIIVSLMDFDQLYALLPKPSVTWNVSQIELWLEFIGLSAYAQQFRFASVDGSCLSDLTEEDIRNQLKISSKIITKKLMTCSSESTLGITQGIQAYDKYLTEKERSMKQTCLGRMPLRSELRQRDLIQQKREEQKWEMEQKREQLFDLQGSAQRRLRRLTAEVQGEKREINQLVIKQCESTIYSCYSLKEHGGMIGRNSKNQIHIVDENVSRFHAQIDFESPSYLIRDCGSSSGTFIRISEKTELKHDHIIQMGSNQFLIDLSGIKTLSMKVVEGPNMGEVFLHTAAKGKFNIGRKTTNQISFPEDQHLSNVHSTAFAIEGIWYIEDLGTTNGTWVRLSPEGIKSESYPLENGTQFKLGSSLTYECQLNESNRKTEKEKSDKCSSCRTAERDCIFLPCKHNVFCYRCTQANELSNCTSCGSEIKESMKIYKV